MTALLVQHHDFLCTEAFTCKAGHDPIELWEHAGVRTPQVGDYGLCWCDPDRERKVVRFERASVSGEVVE